MQTEQEKFMKAALKLAQKSAKLLMSGLVH